MGRLRVSVDQDLCVGHGSCLAIAPAVFRHNAARQSEVVDPNGAPEADILRAASHCPVGAIHVDVADSDDPVESLLP